MYVSRHIVLPLPRVSKSAGARPIFWSMMSLIPVASRFVLGMGHIRGAWAMEYVYDVELITLLHATGTRLCHALQVGSGGMGFPGERGVSSSTLNSKAVGLPGPPPVCRTPLLLVVPLGRVFRGAHG